MQELIRYYFPNPKKMSLEHIALNWHICTSDYSGTQNQQYEPLYNTVENWKCDRQPTVQLGVSGSPVHIKHHTHFTYLGTVPPDWSQLNLHNFLHVRTLFHLVYRNTKKILFSSHVCISCYSNLTFQFTYIFCDYSINMYIIYYDTKSRLLIYNRLIQWLSRWTQQSLSYSPYTLVRLNFLSGSMWVYPILRFLWHLTRMNNIWWILTEL
jgi:hypothetical protein